MLRPGGHLHGVRTVTTRVRPAKLAFVIPDDDPKLALRAVQSCCSSWGGYAYVIVPASREVGLTEDWKAVLKATDPDALVDGGALSDADKEELRAHDLLARDWRDPQGMLFLGETLQLSALEAFGGGFKKPENESFAVVAELAEDHPLYLPLIARWGALDDEALKRAVGYHRHGYRDLPVDHSAMIRQGRVDFSNHPEDLLLGRVPVDGADGADSQGINLAELTQIGLAATGAGWSEGGTPERPQKAEGYADFVIVTSASGGVSDLCLYWNLRGERLGAEPFPLWLPLDMLEGQRGKAIVEQAVGMTRPSVREARPAGSQLYVLSASTSRAELEARLRPHFPDAVIGADELNTFFTGRWQFYLSEEQTPVYFENGHARMPRPRPDNFRHFLPLLDRVAFEVDVDGVWFPQSKAVCDSIYGNRPHRITQNGNLEHLSYTTDRSPRSRLPTIELPDGWTLLTALFAEHGYDCVATEKSNLSLGQLSLIGGLRDLNVLSSSKVHGALKRLSGRRGQGREFAASERRTETINYFDRLWGRDPGRPVLRWLVERRILLRGAELVCRSCRLKRWYAVDRIGEVWRCDGCQQDMPVPLGLDATHWRYRINELFAAAYDQGAVLPLLVVNLLRSDWGRSSDKSGFACYPGVELRARTNAPVPVEHVEIDLVALRHGRMLFFECKESGEQLGEPDEAAKFAQQLSELTVVADHLGASRVVNATTTAFPEDKTPLSTGLSPDRKAEVEWWEGEVILDPYRYAVGEERRPEGWPDQYLNLVSRTLSRAQ